MRLVLSVGGSAGVLALTIQAVLQAQAEGVAREVLAGRRLPPLYSTRIRYAKEPTRGTGVDYFDDPWTVLARGWGDCDDLVVYRTGELLAAGEPAATRCVWCEPRYHVLVRRGDGSLEDPSKELIRMNGRLSQ